MNKKRLGITMIASAVSFIINSMIGFLLTPYVVNNVGAEAYGFVSLANNFTNYAQILTIALNSMAGRFITIAYTRGEKEKAKRYFTSVLYANIVIAVVLLVPCVFVVLRVDVLVNVSRSILRDIQILFALIFGAFLIALVGTTFSNATFMSNRKDLEAKRNIEAYLIKALLLVLLFFFLKPNVIYIGIASLAMTLYTVLMNVRYTRLLTPEICIKKEYFDIQKIKELLSAGVWNSLSRIGSILSDGLDLLITNLMIGASLMGTLSIAKTIPAVISTFIGTMGGIFVPGYTIDFAKNDYNALKRSINKSILILGVISNVCLSVLIVIGVPFFELWVPNENADVLHVLSLLTVMGLSLNGPIQCVWNIFTVTNKVKVNSIVSTSVSFLNIVIVFILLKTTDLGVYAVAGVSSTTMIMESILFSVPYAARCIGFKKRTFYYPMVKNILALVISSFLGGIIESRIVLNNWISLCEYGIFVCIISLFVSISIMTTVSEKKAIIHSLRKF